MPESYPSAVVVYDRRWIASVCYTKLFVVDLETRATRSALLDKNASTYSIAWSPDGGHLAAGGINLLQVFTSDPAVVAKHHVGGKRGAIAVAWLPTGELYVGLGNGEVWRLTTPFTEPTIAYQGTARVLALAPSGIDDRMAVLWDDGSLEVRRGSAVEALIATPPIRSFHAGGPKIGWCDAHQMLVCASGVTSTVIAWRIGAPSYTVRRMERTILAAGLEPSGQRIALGLDEAQREDGQLQTINVSELVAAVAQSSPPDTEPTEPHLFQADWSALLDEVAATQKQQEPSLVVRLDIPVLAEKFAWFESTIRQADADPSIKRELTRNLEHAREQARRLDDELRWAIGKLLEAHFDEHAIRDICDRFTSVAINDILSDLGIEGYPSISYLGKFIAFVFGYAEDDLVDLGFDAADGKGMKAMVPMEFLLEVDKLREVGDALGKKYRASTPREKIFTACQLFHDFDYAFSYYQKRDLWTRYVLPQALWRYPHDDLVVSPSEIEQFGLG